MSIEGQQVANCFLVSTLLELPLYLLFVWELYTLKRICKYCGKEFEAKGTQQYCPGPHYAICEICGKEFEVNPRQPKTTCSRSCASKLRIRTIQKCEKICEICGESFVPTNNTSRYCPGPHYRPCPICGKLVEFTDPSSDIACCSKECTKELRRRTSRVNYGTDVPSQSDEVRKKLSESGFRSVEKRKQTCLDRYGYEHAAQSPVLRQQISNTVKSDSCQKKIQTTIFAKYKVKYAMQNKGLREKQNRNTKRHSNLEIRLHNFLNEYNIEYKSEYVLTNGRHCHSFDAFLPKYNILIDCDSVLFHGYKQDADGGFYTEDTNQNRVTFVPEGYTYIVIIESDFEQGLNYLRKVLQQKDSRIFEQNTELFNWCRSIEFPYPKYTDERLHHDYKLLQQYTFPKGFTTNCLLGMSSVRQFHKSIYHCRVGNQKSIYDAWYNDDLLRSVISNRLIYKNEVDPSIILAGFNIAKIAGKPSVFSPAVAKYLIQTYLQNFDTIFDPFLGFSGRLLGTACLNKHYVGQDIRQEAVNESNEIIQYHGLSDIAQIQQMDILDSEGAYPCLFTCPPYRNKEIYLDNQQNLSCDDWIDICLNRFQCKKYLFVVDSTEKYRDNIVQELKFKSHFRHNSEYVVLL